MSRVRETINEIIKKKMAIGYCDERGKCMKVGAQDANLETLPIWLQHAI
jgi:hypothetical protein